MVGGFEITEAIIIQGITLLTVLNPPLQIPISGKLLDKENKATCIIIAIITAFIILLFFACLGTAVLRFIGITIHSFSVAGGALLFIIGVQIMMSGEPSLDNNEKKEGNNSVKDEKKGKMKSRASCAVPIGTPFIAGPGAITVTTLMIQNDPLTISIFPIVTITAICASLFVTLIVLYFSDKLLNLIKEEGSNVLARIMGIIISAIGVQYIADGFHGLI